MWMKERTHAANKSGLLIHTPSMMLLCVHARPTHCQTTEHYGLWRHGGPGHIRGTVDDTTDDVEEAVVTVKQNKWYSSMVFSRVQKVECGCVARCGRPLRPDRGRIDNGERGQLCTEDTHNTRRQKAREYTWNVLLYITQCLKTRSRCSLSCSGILGFCFAREIRRRDEWSRTSSKQQEDK